MHCAGSGSDHDDCAAHRCRPAVSAALASGATRAARVDAHRAGTAGYIANAGLPLASVLAVATGVFEVVAGLALVVGFKARWAALALGLFTLLASVLFHKFWAVPEAQQYVQQLMFMKNLAVAGGMFMVAAFGAGAMSIDARRAGRA